MLTLWGKIIKGDKVLRTDVCGSDKSRLSDAILECLEHFAKSFDIEAPMWNSSHTKQFGMFRKAVFRPDDFIEDVKFDRFEIQVLDD